TNSLSIRPNSDLSLSIALQHFGNVARIQTTLEAILLPLLALLLLLNVFLGLDGNRRQDETGKRNWHNERKYVYTRF
ncbi:MAG: hypothetical protein ACK56F_28520, partial [bacterium]